VFTPRWDLACVEMWTQACELAPKPILTMYPKGFKPLHQRWPRRNYEDMPPSYLRFRRFNPRTGLVDIKSYQMESSPGKPIRSLFWGGGFSFGSGSQIREVPFDPHCPYVFHGEEIAMAARLWAHGYDFFHPTRMLVFESSQDQDPGRLRKVHWHRHATPGPDLAHGSARRGREQQIRRSAEQIRQPEGTAVQQRFLPP